MQNDSDDLLPATTPQETIADIAAVISSAVPWIGGPVSAVLTGISLNRKIGRVREVLVNMADKVKTLDSESAEKYVQTEDFQDLLEKTLRLAADEREQSKRAAYATFLANDIKAPAQPYDEKIRILRTLEETQLDHIRVLMALVASPDYTRVGGMIGSVRQTLEKRIPGIAGDGITERVQELTRLGLVVEGIRLNTMMTARGAEELESLVTPYGQRFVSYVTDSSKGDEPPNTA